MRGAPRNVVERGRFGRDQAPSAPGLEPPSLGHATRLAVKSYSAVKLGACDKGASVVTDPLAGH